MDVSFQPKPTFVVEFRRVRCLQASPGIGTRKCCTVERSFAAVGHVHADRCVRLMSGFSQSVPETAVVAAAGAVVDVCTLRPPLL